MMQLLTIFPMLQYDFMRHAFLAAVLIAPLFALLGTMAVNNKMAFFSDALGHSAFTGIGLGVLLGMQEPLLAMLAFGIFLGLVITKVKSANMVSSDTVISVFSSAAMALGIVILSASGMCEAGRIKHHLKHNLWRPESTILFVGYQVPGTLGHALLNGAKEVKLFGENIQVHAEILNLPGISGHADRDMLTKWASAFKNPPKRVFVVHGEDKVCDEFAEHLHTELGYQAVAPYSGDTYDLLENVCVHEGTRELVEKKKDKLAKASSNVFARLLAAGQRLLSVIQKNEGIPNKELAKFADQINSLADKWDR